MQGGVISLKKSDFSIGGGSKSLYRRVHWGKRKVGGRSKDREQQKPYRTMKEWKDKIENDQRTIIFPGRLRPHRSEVNKNSRASLRGRRGDKCFFNRET